MPYYATYTGHIQNGIFTTWDDCKKEIHKKPKYKKFKTYAEAEEFHKNGPTYVTDQPASEIAYDIIVYTDGACKRNGTKNASAGYGIYFAENHPLNQCVRLTTGKLTNNVAELTAVIEAIKLISEEYKKIGIYTDSKYTMLCANSYGKKCAKNGWPPDIPNVELVKELYTLVKQRAITLIHVQAHTTEDDIHSNGNREADRLATQSIAN
jgi:ribonuclease HI